ncbi:MAG: TonB-dependent receptor [Rhizobacter sp.]|nr:TonB-dependent receptor [Rhizobacter sp.]
MVVTATRFAEDADNLPFGVSVLTARDLRRAGVATVNEALMKLLGVPGRLDFYGGGDYSLDLRGFGGTADNNQAVIVDGVRINEADQGGTRLAGIPIDSVERIEVIRASSAVLYGEGATGGAIVITTRGGHDAPRPDTANGYVAIGSQGLTEVHAGTALSGGGLSVDVSANKRATDGHRDNFRSGVEGLAVNGQWRRDALRIGVRHAQDTLHTGLPGALTAAEYEADPTQTTHPDDRADIEHDRSSVFAELSTGPWQVVLDAGRRTKALRSLTSFGGSPLSPYDYDIDARQRSGRVRHEARLGAIDNVFVGGVDHGEWQRDVRSPFGSSVAEQRTTGVYVKDDLAVRSGTRLSAGTRSERVRKTLSTVAGSPVDDRFNAWEAGVVQDIAERAAVFARLARSFRFANADEFSYTTGELLRPQTSRDLDLGARWRYASGRAELRYYRNALHDEIGFDPTQNGGFGANVNLPDTLRQGLELEALHDVSKVLQLRANAALRRAKFIAGANDGRDIALTPRRTLSLGADWQAGRGHSLGASVNVVSSQYPDFANSCRMPSYSTLDARYAYRTDAVELAVGVRNLTDRDYYTRAYACTGGSDNRPTSLYPEAGRAVSVSARMSF